MGGGWSGLSGEKAMGAGPEGGPWCISTGGDVGNLAASPIGGGGTENWPGWKSRGSGGKRTCCCCIGGGGCWKGNRPISTMDELWGDDSAAAVVLSSACGEVPWLVGEAGEVLSRNLDEVT